MYGRKLANTVTSYTEAAEFIGKRPQKKAAHATYVVRLSDTEIAVKYHNTFIVRFKQDGCIVLDTGGWRTMSTKGRINQFLPKGCRLGSLLGKWYVSFYKIVETDDIYASPYRHVREVDFDDEMRIYSAFEVYVDAGTAGWVAAPDADPEADKRAYRKGVRFSGRRSTPMGQRGGRVWQRGDENFVASYQQSRMRVTPPPLPVLTQDEIERERARADEREIARILDERDAAWRAAQNRETSTTDVETEGVNYVPGWAKPGI